ncbi:hypothetical protein ECP030481612_5067 [Escherichia coli P0304816.12]|nr:hypothetical protein ECP030481612_5067 [Escherichia coli P0304816.12]
MLNPLQVPDGFHVLVSTARMEIAVFSIFSSTRLAAGELRR